MSKPRLALTLGDPCGVGPELILKAALNPRFKRAGDIVVVGDYSYLAAVQRRFRSSRRLKLIRVPYREWTSLDQPSTGLTVIDLENIRPKPIFGRATAWGGKASGDFIAAAVEGVQHRLADALVTLPINKKSFQMGGWGRRFIGHTEMLGALTKTDRFALMLAVGNFRAVHVTQHIPLNRVATVINARRIEETIVLAHTGLQQMGIRRPRLAVCGLNPHAGDSGVLGREEERMITPAIRACVKKGIQAFGPLSADVVWPHVRDGRYDAGVAMYHDQGQIAVKLMGFQEGTQESVVAGVNVTLGLPLIRTSVAHGTAYDIAGRGVASPESLLEAIELASQMVKGRPWN